MGHKDFDTNAIAKDIIVSNLKMNKIPYDYFYFKLDGDKYNTIIVNEGVESKWCDVFDSTQFDIETNVKVY